ncbi:hypothetical protein Sgleb_32350 [Streptomyces glebosus]|uniref:Uncharacterized protein n=1 Tax=Streptomyces glebosus TaxID=249580 RepID=A0A640SVY5_9ACTN|nr:hypothetical protein Sgleb_32350 [Streptomyces glebosus]
MPAVDKADESDAMTAQRAVVKRREAEPRNPFSAEKVQFSGAAVGARGPRIGVIPPVARRSGDCGRVAHSGRRIHALLQFRGHPRFG